jgi:hypothetical protein
MLAAATSVAFRRVLGNGFVDCLHPDLVALVAATGRSS